MNVDCSRSILHDAIPAYKTALTLPFTEGSEQSATVSTSETPLRTELRHYFVRHLRTKETALKTKRKHIAIHATGDALTNDDVLKYLKENTRSKKPSKQMASSKKVLQPKSSNNKVKKNTKTTVLVSHDSEEDSNDENYTTDDDEDSSHCFSCGKQYEDGQEHLWVGCDTCYWWYHFKCAGFSRCPTRKDEFICCICSS